MLLKSASSRLTNPKLIAALLSLSIATPALAGTTEDSKRLGRGGDSNSACSIPEPDLSLDPHPDDGIGLGPIIEQEKTTSKGYIQTIEPRLHLEWGSSEQIINLSETKQKKLVFGNTSKGFQAIDFNEKGIGLGIAGSMEFPNSTFLGNSVWATVGLLPIKGRHSMAIRFFPSVRALENRSDVPSLREAQSAFANMVPGDVLTYNTYGGIVFWAGFGASFIGVQTAAMARGDFQVYMEKLDSDHVYVKVSDSHIESLGLQVGALLSHVSATQYSRYGKAFGFALNMRDPMGVRAYRDLVRGNIAPVQKLAMRAGSTSVRFWDEADTVREGTSSYVKYFGIPFLFKISWSRDRYFEASRRKSYECGRTLNAVYGAYFTQKYLKLYPYEKTTTKAFYGTSYALKNDKSKSVARGFFGHMLYTYENSDGTVRALRHAMERMGEDTGLGDLLMLDMPEKSGRYNNVSLQLRAQFSAQNTQNIVARAGRNLFSSLKDFGGKVMATTLAEGKPATSLCREEDGALDERTCLDLVARRTNSGMEKMARAAVGLKRALRTGNEKLATMAYARFGEAMLTNQFTFKAGMMLAGDSMKVDYIVSGSHFSRYTATFHTSGYTGRLVRDQREPIIRRVLGPSKDATGKVIEDEFDEIVVN